MNRRKGKYPRKIIALIASFVLVVGLIPVPAIASGGADSGPGAAAEAPSAAPGAEGPLVPPDESGPGASEQPSADEPEAPGANAAPGEALGKAGGVSVSGQVDTNGIGDAKAEGPDTGGEKAQGEAAGANGPEAPATPAEPAQVSSPAFCESSTVDGVTVTVEADAGVFPEGAGLFVESVPSSATEAAVAPERDADVNVAASYTFDIKVLDADGQELQPADGKTVRVSFEAPEVADPNLDVSVYHVADGGAAEELGVDVSGATATAKSDGFSNYVVEFTYGDLKYVFGDENEVVLSELLWVVGLTGEVTDVEVSNSTLFSAYDSYGQWVVVSYQTFNGEEWMRVTIAGKTYEITVTSRSTGGVTWTLENGVLTISGEGAMESYSDQYLRPWDDKEDAITSVVIQNGVTSIGDRAFNKCENLKSVSIPNSVKTIGNYSFEGCRALESVEIPNSVKTIGICAFNECRALTEVEIPNSVEAIGGSAFSNCGEITSVTVPGNVKTIGNYAFGECDKLELVEIKYGVMAIGEDAFEDCKKLGVVVIPSSLTSLPSNAFPANESGLTIYFGGTREQYAELTGESIDVFRHELRCMPAVSISASPEGDGDVTGFETCIDRSSDGEWSYTATATPKNGSTFVNWTNGAGEEVSTEATHTFPVGENGLSLKANFVTESVSYTITAEANPTAGGTVTGGGTYARGRMVNLEATPKTGYQFVDWTEGGTRVSTDATYSFVATGNRTLKANFVEGVGGTCGDNLTWALSGGTLTISKTGEGDGKMTDYEMNGNSGASPWSGNKSITSIVIEEGVTSVGKYAFQECSSLTSVTIPSGVTGIGARAFDKCGALEEIDIPASVTSIGVGAFNESGLTSVDIPAGVTSIGGQAFMLCSSLESVVFQGSVGSIGEAAFCSTPLKSIVFPGTVGSIEKFAFMLCSSLESVVFQGSVGSIGNSAFSECTSWKDVYCYGTPNQWKTIANNYWGTGGSNVGPTPHYTEYAVTTSPSPGNCGSSRIEWSWPDNSMSTSSATLTATPAEGYHLASWTKNGAVVSTSNPFNLTATEDAQYVANFEPNDASYVISATANDANAGTVTGGGTYTYGDTVALAAAPADGYAFDCWTEGGERVVGAGASYTFIATVARALTANFWAVSVGDIADQTYTGAAVEPRNLDVQLIGVDGVPSNAELVEGTDYTLSYEDNVNAGEATVIVTLDNKFVGEARKTFRIAKADLSTASVEAADQVYDGTAQKPVPMVTWNEKQVAQDDYAAAYASNVRAGTATVTVTGKRNFTGTASGTFEIARRPLTVTADSAERGYDGSALTADGFTSEGLAQGDRVASAKVEGSQTDIGSSANKVSGAKIVNAAGEDVTDCYDITYKPGTLTVKPGEGGAYVPAEGSGQAWAKGSTEALTFAFKSATGDDGRTFELFEGVEVDGKAVPEKDSSGKANWTAKKGSLILSLQPSFLETLSDGEHTVTALFDDGVGEATFKVTAAKAPGAPAAGTDNKTTDNKDTTSKKTPRTGDVVGGATGVIAVLAAALVMASRRRRHVLGGRPGGKRG